MSTGRSVTAPLAQVYNPVEYAAEVHQASTTFDDLLNPLKTQWTDFGEHPPPGNANGGGGGGGGGGRPGSVRIYRTNPPLLPGRDLPGPSVLPLVRSEILIEDATTLELLACVHLSAYRCLFQPRIRCAYYLRRFGLYHNQYYAVLGFGKGFASRDFVGVQHAQFYDEHGNEVGHPSERAAPPPRIDLIFASVEDPRVPPQEGKVRARYWHCGFRFTSTERGTLVQYISQIDYGEPIPAYILKVMWLEVPLTIQRLREAYRLLGFPPYVLDPTHTIVMQLQSFDVETRAVSISALVVRAGTFTIVIDSRRMYKQGVFVSDRSGPAVPSLRIEEKDGNVQVRTFESGVGHAFELIFQACDQEKQEPDDSMKW